MRYPSVVALLLFVRACSNADHDDAREVCEAADAVRECYGAALVHAPTISGTVKFNFVIGADGNVPASVVQESTLKNPAVGTCMAKAIKRLQFPQPSSADPVMVTVPYTLSPGEYASE